MKVKINGKMTECPTDHQILEVCDAMYALNEDNFHPYKFIHLSRKSCIKNHGDWVKEFWDLRKKLIDCKCL